MYNKNNKGPRIDPCGAPDEICKVSEKTPFTNTLLSIIKI